MAWSHTKEIVHNLLLIDIYTWLKKAPNLKQQDQELEASWWLKMLLSLCKLFLHVGMSTSTMYWVLNKIQHFQVLASTWMFIKHAGNRDNSRFIFFMDVFQNKQSSCKWKWRAMSISPESYWVESFFILAGPLIWRGGKGKLFLGLR
jgi:hypothetical protein